MATPIRTDAPPEERVRFWSNVSMKRGVLRCWDWKGAASAAGYGLFTLDGERVPSHRVAYAFAYDVDPGDRMVLHACDREQCNNPRHLRLGGPEDNAADRAVAGLMERLRASFARAGAVVPVANITPRPSKRKPKPRDEWRKVHVPNETALAIRYSFFALGVRDIDAIAAAHGVKPGAALGILRRDRNRGVPRVKGEPKPNGSCGHHRLSTITGGPGKGGWNRGHGPTVTIPAAAVRDSVHRADGERRTAGNCTESQREFAGLS